MSNPNATGMTAQHGRSLVARTRKMILNAFDVVDTRGKPIVEYLADAFIENPLKFMDTASRYMPKDIQVDVTHSNNASGLSDDEIAHEIATRARQRLEAARDITDEVEVVSLGVSSEPSVSE